MPGTPIAQAPDASNPPNPTSSIQSPGNHEQLADTNIHCRSISQNSEFGYFKVIPIRIFYRPLGNNCPLSSSRFRGFEIVIDSIFIRTLESPTTAYASFPRRTRVAFGAMPGHL
jgi:hypothetical protein